MQVPVVKMNWVVNSQNSRNGNPCTVAGVAIRHIVALFMFVSLCGCETRQQMVNAAPSLEDLGKQVLAAVEKNNFNALDSMRLTEQEYRAYIWPALPVSKIKQWQKQYQYVWGDVDTKSKYGLQLMLGKHGGQKFDFVRIRFAENTEKYHDCTVHKDAWLTLKDRSGAEKELKLFGSVVESSGRYKVMSFNIH
jgi:hypothetical protein